MLVHAYMCECECACTNINMLYTSSHVCIYVYMVCLHMCIQVLLYAYTIIYDIYIWQCIFRFVIKWQLNKKLPCVCYVTKTLK